MARTAPFTRATVNVYTGVVLNTEPSAHVADEPVKTIEKNMEILLDENVDSKDDVAWAWVSRPATSSLWIRVPR